MQVDLVMFRADGERRSFSLPRDVTVIGRREDCDLRIPLGDVSRKHCRLIKEADTLRLEDLGSSNGTYHNGQRVQESIVQPGDTIQIGPVVFVCRINGEPADEQLHPYDPAEAAASMAGDVVDADQLDEIGEEDAYAAADDPTVARRRPSAPPVPPDLGGQEQTLAGDDAAADFDPMEVLQQTDEEDDLVDFNLTDDETAEQHPSDRT